jgi:IclR family mhp operon transcriptional activator
MKQQEEVKALKKALRALSVLNCNGQSKASEVARGIDVPRTTSYRLLETLASEGYIEKLPNSDLYRLTSLVNKLASGFGDSELIVEVAKPLMTKIGADIRWPIGLATPRGDDMLVRFNTDKDAPLAIDRFRIGFSIPMLNAPTGLCYLAYCDETDRKALLERSRQSGGAFDKLNQHGGIVHLLSQVKETGWCNIRYGEYREAGFAVPLRAGNKIIGSLIMRYAKAALTDSEVQKTYLPIMRNLSNEISKSYTNSGNYRV